MSSSSSDIPQHDRGVAINLARGRAADFIDRPLQDGEVFDRVAMGMITDDDIEEDETSATADNDDDEGDENNLNSTTYLAEYTEIWEAANSNFVSMLEQRITSLPGRDTWTESVSAERHVVFFLVAARRIFHDASLQEDLGLFFECIETQLTRYMVIYGDSLTITDIPDRNLTVVELANRVYDGLRDELLPLDFSDGNPFLSAVGVPILRVRLLAHVLAHLRRAIRSAPSQRRRQLWLAAQSSFVSVINSFDDFSLQHVYQVV